MTLSRLKTLRADLAQLRQFLPSTEERLEDWKLYASDPVLWAREILGFHPDPWQAEFLRSRSKNVILNCSRQSGKSSVASILALHESIYLRPSFALIISPSLDLSLELMAKFDDYRGAVDLPSDYLTAESKLAVKFANGNRVLARPGSEKTARSFSAVTLLLEDESARVPEEVYNSIRPMLAVSNGRHVLMSTPFGKSNHFYRIWSEQADIWERYEVPAEECPRITKEFLDQERRTNPWFEQEYHCVFMDSENQFFSSELIERIFSANIEPLEID